MGKRIRYSDTRFPFSLTDSFLRSMIWLQTLQRGWDLSMEWAADQPPPKPKKKLERINFIWKSYGNRSTVQPCINSELDFYANQQSKTRPTESNQQLVNWIPRATTLLYRDHHSIEHYSSEYHEFSSAFWSWFWERFKNSRNQPTFQYPLLIKFNYRDILKWAKSPADGHSRALKRPD